MNEPFGNHKFFFAHEFPWSITVPDNRGTIIVSHIIDGSIVYYEEQSYPYLKAALCQRLIDIGETDGFK